MEPHGHGDGDGWVVCAAGHRHWGRHGAAGLLLSADDRVVLQHRSARTHEGGTWALPGGARDSHEDVVQTALREAEEEAAIEPRSVRPVGWSRVDHGGWSYTTVRAEVAGPLQPHAANWESDEVRWWPRVAVAGLPLHPGFAAAWPTLHRHDPGRTVIVDAANVVGSRPDGWWRDRPGAARRLLERLRRLARHGIAGGATTVLPRIVMVVEGEAARAPIPAVGVDWWDRSVLVVPADGSGDDEIVDQAHRWTGEVDVVTADRGLIARLPAQVGHRGPTWLLDLLPADG